MRCRFLLIFSIAILFTVNGQDTLVLDNERLPVKVIKVAVQEITYKKWSNLDGPEYVISKTDVQMIKYKNGGKDIFNREIEHTLKRNAAFLGFGGLNYFISLNYERKLFFTKRMNFFIIKAGVGCLPILSVNTKDNRAVFTLATSFTYNLKLDVGNSIEFGGGVGYYSLANSNGYPYFTPIVGFRRESASGVLFKFYMSALTVNQSSYESNYNFKYYPFIGIDVGLAF